MSDKHFAKQITEVVAYGNKCGSFNLVNTTDTWEGQKMKIDDREMINLGTCGYLGLETDRRLIERSREYADKFGTQFSVGRPFMMSNLLTNLESQLQKVFDGHLPLVYSSTSLAHTSVMPMIIRPKDAILYDKQVHFSVFVSTQLIPYKVPMHRIEHSNMNMLEDQIKALKDNHKKIWFLSDGVFSMFGDILLVDALNELMTKYEQLHIYIDDAHGMAWAGTVSYTHLTLPTKA